MNTSKKDEALEQGLQQGIELGRQQEREEVGKRLVRKMLVGRFGAAGDALWSEYVASLACGPWDDLASHIFAAADVDAMRAVLVNLRLG